MKILHISSVPVEYMGGTEKVIWELAKRQRWNNIVTILQTNLYMPDKKESNILKDGVRIITCKNDFWLGGFGYSRSFINKFKEIFSEFDIVHIHGHGRFTSTFSLFFLKNKKPIVYSAQGFFHKKNFIKSLYDRIFGGLIKNATICTALTSLEKKHLEDKFGIPSKKIKIVSGGIDYKLFNNFNKIKIEKFKKRFNLDNSTEKILYVGRIHESKGLQYVLESIKDLKIELVVVGRFTKYQEFLKNRAKELHISNKVKFLGELKDEELPLAYHSANAFVLFSEWEGFGIVAIEAMAAGLPVVVSDNGALPILVANEKNGFVAQWPSIENLKEKILISLGSKNKRKIIAEGLKTAKNYDWDKINRYLEKIYETATKK